MPKSVAQQADNVDGGPAGRRQPARPTAQLSVGTERGVKVSESVARRLVRDIYDLGLEPGTALPAQSEMLEQIGVGRDSVREALRVLETLGLVAIKPGPGGGPIVQDARHQFGRTSTFYFHLSGATTADLLGARRELEPIVARLAADNVDPQSIAALEANVASARSAIDAEADIRVWGRLTGDFHTQLREMCGNRILGLYSQSLKDLFSQRLEGRASTPEQKLVVCNEHEAILDTIRARDGGAAQELMSKHMGTLAELTAQRYPGRLDDLIDWR